MRSRIANQRAEMLFSEDDPDVQAMDAQIDQAIRDWEGKARREGREAQIHEGGTSGQTRRRTGLPGNGRGAPLVVEEGRWRFARDAHRGGTDRPSVEAWPGEEDEDRVQLWISDEEKKRHGLMPGMKIPDEVVEKIRLENGMPPLATPQPEK